MPEWSKGADLRSAGYAAWVRTPLQTFFIVFFIVFFIQDSCIMSPVVHKKIEAGFGGSEGRDIGLSTKTANTKLGLTRAHV